MRKDVEKAIVRMLRVYGLLPDPDQGTWVSPQIPFSIEQLRVAYPNPRVCQGRAMLFRRDNGLRSVFTQEEAAKGPEFLDLEEVLELRKKLTERQVNLVEEPFLK